MRSATFATAIAAFSVVPSAVSYPFVSQQAYSQPERRDDVVNRERAEAVKEAFQHAFDGYMKYAYPKDDLRPVSNTSGNSRNGWGASAVDALSTALVMRNTGAVDKILEHIAGIDYTQTNSQVSLFETTIRYLGGMLSGYDLIKGPLSDVPSDDKYVEALKAKSVELADVLKFAFDSKTGIPSNGLNIGDKTTDGSTTNGIATIGTLVLEWTRLSEISGNAEYGKLAQKGEEYLLKPQPDWAQPFPGLIGTRVDINTGLFQDNSVSWGASDDSFYEYLIKMYVYDKQKFGFYKDRWVAAAESTIKNLKSSPSSRPDITFVATYNNGTYGLDSQHLTCFDGGNFILGGQVLGRDDFLQFGLDLVNGCHETYVQTATRIGPEQFSWNTNRIPSAWKDFYERAGFYITSSGYNLRPEVIESYYYAYRATLDSKYQDWAWDAFVAINKTTRTGSGFSAVNDVNNPTGGSKTDYQESFLFAEVLKYAYIIHTGDDDWQVDTNGRNKFVYNTEAHPVKVKG